MAAPLAEGPAEYAGILRGERILQIGTMPTSGGGPHVPDRAAAVPAYTMIPHQLIV